MTAFSEKVKAAIEQCGIPIGLLAERSGMSASMLYKIQSGARLPDSLDTLNRLISAMVCSLPEQLELTQAYKIERIGISRYEYYQEFKGILADIADLAPTIREPMTDSGARLPRTIGGPRNVNAAVLTLLEREVRRDGGQIDMMTPVRYHYGLDCVSQVLANCDPGFRCIRHLFCLKSSGTDEALLHNMTAIRALLPRMLNLERYDPWYSYLPDPDDRTVPFPYIILTSEGVLLLDSIQHNAIFLDDPEILAMYHRNFELLTHRFTPVMHTGEGTFRNYVSIHAKIISSLKKRPHPIAMAAQPCILPCMRSEAIGKYVPEDILRDNTMLEGIRDFFRGSSEGGYTTFFTMDGLQQLLTQGKIMEMIGPDVPRMEQEDILDALEELIRRAKAGRIIPYMFRQEMFQGSTRMSLGLYGSVLFVACDVPTRNLLFNDMTEATMARVLKDYSEDALQLGDVFSPEESIRILEREVRRFRKAAT
ncbi:MAG: helix-turn-helix transcriptional regulator [Oscillospiraceae bacterium]|nr:helix-turn-helix transcriptional regulator [Oscillospiraceae bacterium]